MKQAKNLYKVILGVIILLSISFIIYFLTLCNMFSNLNRSSRVQNQVSEIDYRRADINDFYINFLYEDGEESKATLFELSKISARLIFAISEEDYATVQSLCTEDLSQNIKKNSEAYSLLIDSEIESVLQIKTVKKNSLFLSFAQVRVVNNGESIKVEPEIQFDSNFMVYSIMW